jgi:hypothetical protein
MSALLDAMRTAADKRRSLKAPAFDDDARRRTIGEALPPSTPSATGPKHSTPCPACAVCGKADGSTVEGLDGVNLCEVHGGSVLLAIRKSGRAST